MRQIKQFFLERDSPTLSLLQPKQEGIILIPEPNYQITKIFEKNLLAIEMKKSTQILLKKIVFLGLSILEINKIVIFQFCYDYVKPKYEKKRNVT